MSQFCGLEDECVEEVANEFITLHRSEVDGIEETRFLQAMFSSAALIMANLYGQAEQFQSEPAEKIKTWLTELFPVWNNLVENMNTIESDIADRTIYFKGPDEPSS